MISHCANPDCKLPFHYLRGGRLYRIDIRHLTTPCRDVPNFICSMKRSHASVFFWLCEQCSLKFSLRFKVREGLALAPLTGVLRERGGAMVVAVSDSASNQR